VRHARGTRLILCSSLPEGDRPPGCPLTFYVSFKELIERPVSGVRFEALTADQLWTQTNLGGSWVDVVSYYVCSQPSPTFFEDLFEILFRMWKKFLPPTATSPLENRLSLSWPPCFQMAGQKITPKKAASKLFMLASSTKPGT